MTFAGKIMVFVILVFCVACMVLALTVYTAQHTWPERYEALSKDNQDLQNKLSAAISARDDFDKQLQQTQADRQESETALNAQIEGLKSERDDLRNSESELRQQLASFQQSARDSTEEALFRRDEVNALREKWQVALNDRDQAITDRVQAEDERNVAQQQLETAEQRNKSLLERAAQLVNIVRSLGGDPNQPADAAPPEVEGYVRNATPDSELVEVSIGSDDGLQRGHRLDVYRVGNTPEKAMFLGRIEIREVDPDRAVGTYLRPRRGKIQKGDHVTSKLR